MRKLVAGVAVLVLAALAVWWFALRDRAPAPAPAKPPAAAAPGKPLVTAAREQPAAAPSGAAPRWTLDRDPVGALTLEGQVVGPDGAGVGGATVRLASVPPRTTTSEQDGTFSFDKLVGRTYAVSARTATLIGGPVSHRLTAASDPVVVRLVEGATVAVSVVDEAKQPIAGAEVRAGDGGVSATTAADGTTSLAPVRPGYVAVTAVASGFAPGVGFVMLGSAGAKGSVQLVLRKGVAVAGRVRDEAGAAIAGVRVSLGSGSASWIAGALGGEERSPISSVTDAQGRYEIAAVAAGSHVLDAVDGEHVPAQVPITVSDRPLRDVDIEMRVGGRLAGTVVDKDRQPVPYATVRIAGKGAQMWQVARQVVGDAKGAFEVRGLHRAVLQARAESETAASALVEVDLAAAPVKADVVLVLDVTGTIAGKVVDEAGLPVPEVQVNAFPDLLGGASADGLGLAGMSSTTTDGAGTFTIHGLPDGAYRLWATRSQRAAEWGQHGAGAKTGDKGVLITLPAPGGITGKLVLEGASTPPVLASVQIGMGPTTPVRDGAFELRDVSPGTHDLTLRGAEFAELRKSGVVVAPGKLTDVGTITVIRGRRLTGTVVDGKGAPVANARVKLGDMLFAIEGGDEAMAGFEDMAGIRSATTDQAGAFAIIGVPQKATTAMADHAERGRSLGVEVPGGTDDPPPVRLALRGYGSIAGRVTQRGEGLANVTVSDSAKGGGAQATFAQTDATGQFKLARVAEGVHVLSAMQSKMMSMKSASVTVTVVAGREATVAIDIPIGSHSLAVKIAPLGGAKVDAAQVFLFEGSVAPKNAKQLTDGMFQGGAQGMEFWFGGAAPMPVFKELVAGSYSVCSIPITGNLQEPAFQQRLQRNMEALKVYCRAVRITEAPAEQTLSHELPAMEPLPE